jgi:hypothetical protein
MSHIYFFPCYITTYPVYTATDCEIYLLYYQIYYCPMFIFSPSFVTNYPVYKHTNFEIYLLYYQI